MGKTSSSKSALDQAVSEDRRYLVGHVSVKMMQSGALMFSAVYPMIALLRQEANQLPLVLRSVGRISFVYGAPLGALVATARLWAEPEWFIRDRAFSLRNNESQRRVDRFSYVGAFLGGTATAFMPKVRAGPILSRAPGGAALGLAGGVIAHIATSEDLALLLNWHGMLM